MHHGAADALVPFRKEQRVPVFSADGTPHLQIAVQGILAGVVQIHHADFVSLPQYPQGVVLDITNVQPDQLRDTQAAVEKQRDNAEIPLFMLAVHSVQEGKGVVQRQIAGEGLHLLGRVNVLTGILLQKMNFVT